MQRDFPDSVAMSNFGGESAEEGATTYEVWWGWGGGRSGGRRQGGWSGPGAGGVVGQGRNGGPGG